jgi:hypothetical protein
MCSVAMGAAKALLTEHMLTRLRRDKPAPPAADRESMPPQGQRSTALEGRVSYHRANPKPPTRDLEAWSAPRLLVCRRTGPAGGAAPVTGRKK